jgi:uncharacterized protein (TIGR02652 family)
MEPYYSVCKSRRGYANGHLLRAAVMNFAFQHPIFGPEIQCPHCRQMIPALTLTDTYLCDRHGAFEANPETSQLVHLQSNRNWCRWEDEWYRQHVNADGIRFEIHDALDKLYTQGYRATKVIIAQRYRDSIASHLIGESSAIEILVGGVSPTENSPLTAPSEPLKPRLFGLPVEFSPPPSESPCWAVINFTLEKEPGIPIQYPYFRG